MRSVAPAAHNAVRRSEVRPPAGAEARVRPHHARGAPLPQASRATSRFLISTMRVTSSSGIGSFAGNRIVPFPTA